MPIMQKQQIKDYLYLKAEPKYAAFASSLIPKEQRLIGVRLPELRKLAGELAKGDFRAYLSEADDETFEEILLQGMVIGKANMPFEEQMNLMTCYVSKISNWSLCDSACAGFKFVRKQRAYVWEFLRPYWESRNEFEQRFAVVMLMDHFRTDEFIDRLISLWPEINPAGYYASMAVAWAVSVCFVKYPDLTLPLLENKLLDTETHLRTIQKILDSKRVDENVKTHLRALK